MFIIYQATNTANGKRYIGYTGRSLKRRWWDHVNRAAKKPAGYFHLAINKWGQESFVVEEIFKEETREGAIETEILTILDRSPEYNSTFGGEGGHFTDEIIAKLAAAATGKSPSKESRDKASASLKGRKFSEQHRVNIAAAAKARANTPEGRAAMGNLNKREYSAETRAKFASTSANRVWSDQSRAKLSASGKRRVPSEETKAKISAGVKRHFTVNSGRPVSEETRTKPSMTLKAYFASTRGEP